MCVWFQWRDFPSLIGCCPEGAGQWVDEWEPEEWRVPCSWETDDVSAASCEHKPTQRVLLGGKREARRIPEKHPHDKLDRKHLPAWSECGPLRSQGSNRLKFTPPSPCDPSLRWGGEEGNDVWCYFPLCSWRSVELRSEWKEGVW